MLKNMDDEFKSIRCLMDMLKQNLVHEYTLKERLIAKRLFKESTLAQEDDPIFYNIVKQNPTADFIVALQFISVKENIVLGVLSQHMVTPLIAQFIMMQDHIKFVHYSIISISII